MHRLILAATLSLAAVPAMAGGMSFDLPVLTWPEETKITTSTKSCTQIIVQDGQETTTACK